LAQGQAAPDIAVAGLLTGVCTHGDPPVQRHWVRGAGPSRADGSSDIVRSMAS
jgi:hypothetical protein